MFPSTTSPTVSDSRVTSRTLARRSTTKGERRCTVLKLIHRSFFPTQEVLKDLPGCRTADHDVSSPMALGLMENEGICPSFFILILFFAKYVICIVIWRLSRCLSERRQYAPRSKIAVVSWGGCCEICAICYYIHSTQMIFPSIENICEKVCLVKPFEHSFASSDHFRSSMKSVLVWSRLLWLTLVIPVSDSFSHFRGWSVFSMHRFCVTTHRVARHIVSLS
jgi:hypothetical protein